MAVRKKRAGAAHRTAVFCLIAFAAGFVGGVALADRTSEIRFVSDPEPGKVLVDGELSIHFLELGNKYTGDCTYIKAGETDILIDAGSKKSSIPTIDAYLKQYVTDGVLEYVIVTHAHEDHYAGFATYAKEENLFDLYSCRTIIDFPLTNQQNKEGSLYSNYLRARDREIAEGAVHYTAAECIEQGKNIFELDDGITLEILNSYYYTHETSGENNYSVCTLIRQDERSFLFTGDLEEEGEKYLTELNDLPEVVLYKAGHHGSKTSSTEALLNVIQPQIVCVCCCAGSSEYTSKNENQFPTQAFVDRVAPFTDRVYVTTLCTDYKGNQFESMNGNITVRSDSEGVRVDCSASDLLLCESDWFRKNRICPKEWEKS